MFSGEIAWDLWCERGGDDRKCNLCGKARLIEVYRLMEEKSPLMRDGVRLLLCPLQQKKELWISKSLLIWQEVILRYHQIIHPVSNPQSPISFPLC